VKDDPLKQQLLKELRELRRGEGAFSPDRLSQCEALVRVVGMGSVEQAHATLFEMFKRYAVEPDGDIRAFLETSGIGLEGRSLNLRLDAYAATHHVDQRTGLRRSDRGSLKLATLFRDEELFFRPWGHLNLYQFGSHVLVSIGLHMDPGSEYRPPAVWINDELQHDLTWQFETTADAAGYVRALNHLDGYTLQPEGQWLFKVDVEWRMGVWPTWVLASQLADNRLVTKLQAQRNFMSEATITWGAWPGQEMRKSEPFGGFDLHSKDDAPEAEGD
jgi:hypothetical protein